MYIVVITLWLLKEEENMIEGVIEQMIEDMMNEIDKDAHNNFVEQEKIGLEATGALYE